MEMEQKNQGTLGSIEDQFNLIAEEYDMNRRKFIPCFEDYYKNTTKFIVSNIHKPKRILDLGAGTGLLSYFWYLYFPASEYVLVDIADDMLQVARKRFAGIDTVLYLRQTAGGRVVCKLRSVLCRKGRHGRLV